MILIQHISKHRTLPRRRVFSSFLSILFLEQHPSYSVYANRHVFIWFTPMSHETFAFPLISGFCADTSIVYRLRSYFDSALNMINYYCLMENNDRYKYYTYWEVFRLMICCRTLSHSNALNQLLRYLRGFWVARKENQLAWLSKKIVSGSSYTFGKMKILLHFTSLSMLMRLTRYK